MDPSDTKNKVSVRPIEAEFEAEPVVDAVERTPEEDRVDALVIPGDPVGPSPEIERKRAVRNYLLLPIIFLTATLLGGLRFAASDGAFVFVPPALICLIFAAVLCISFVRGGMIAIDHWFSDGLSTTQNIANGTLLASVYSATVQVFNSVLPESGLPFWVVVFCFAWSLWNNLFTGFDSRKLLRSMIALFSFAFIAKYLILAGLTAPPGDGGWLRALIENPAREAMTWLLDLPRYSAGTGYLQFFTLGLYFLGLYLLPRSTRSV